MYVDVPKGTGQSFEAAGQKGYQTGGQVGAGLVVGGAGWAEGVPLLEAIGGHLSTIKSIIDTAAKIGVAGMSYREARELYKEFVSQK